MNNKPIIYWLLGCSAIISAMLVAGGATRLTRYGLAMSSYNSYGGLPPRTQRDWEITYDKYQQFPESRERTGTTLKEFKRIYWGEYLHLMFGKSIGLAIFAPFIYFYSRGQIPPGYTGRMGLILGLGATQCLLGWSIVKNGLKNVDSERTQPERIPYQLSAHFLTGFATYFVVLWTALDLMNPRSKMAELASSMSTESLNNLRKIKQLTILTTVLAGVTMATGALMAGNDAGREYNTFPKMDGEWVPKGFIDKNLTPRYRNFFENIATVNFEHRHIAGVAATSATLLVAFAARKAVWPQIPLNVKRGIIALGLLAGQQLGIGIYMLLSKVPVGLAFIHQFGAIGILTSATWILHSLKFLRNGKNAQKIMETAKETMKKYS